MKLYHGSLEVVRLPEIRVSRRLLDYGQGFYATTSCTQAEGWVRRRMEGVGKRVGYVNVYNFDEGVLKVLRCLIFRQPDEAWLDFVMRNRQDPAFNHDYDIVYGPVANDKVYAAFSLYESGILDQRSLIAELKTYRLVDQYLFHTNRALQSLTFLSTEEIKR